MPENSFINDLLKDPNVIEILKKVKNNNHLCPKFNLIFKALELTKVEDTKVVIFGQDPYYLPNVANGLAFSTNQDQTPKSLLNIFLELKNEYPNITIETNDLSYWAKQGVLLLNTHLTTEEFKPNFHKDLGWDYVIKKVINFINNNLRGVIFLLWGNEAKKIKMMINEQKHYVLTTSHPSPLSAHQGFFGSNHFLKTNEILKNNGRLIIDWNLKKE